jgi:transcriptional regulator with GAF, ATPase, and Fis domain
LGEELARRTVDPTRRIGAAPALPKKLVVVAGVDAGVEIPLDGVVEVGSDPGCGLPLRDPSVSRRHASFACVAGTVVVKDLGSRNGTLLGGVRVLEAEVQLGALLALGDTQLAIQPRWHAREVPPSSACRFGELLGVSTAMREVFAILERVAPGDATVLLEGESGTGKELAARAIHAASPRAAAPLVVFDCGAVPRELAESELFGHRRGAFSGAVADRAGALARSHGGTLFLDEIGELPLELQPRLLRVLESGEVKSVGDDSMRRVDARVIAATHRDLAAEVRAGRFRADLLYRLEVVRVRLPPLRERPEDVPALVAQLLDGRLPPGDAIAGENLRKLVGYSWPGNVRELRNVLTRAVALARTTGPAPFARLVINLGAPAPAGAAHPGAAPLPYKLAKERLVAGFDRAYLTHLLSRHGRDVRAAAKEAGVSRKHLYELLRRAGL